MRSTARQTHATRTIPVDCQNEATSFPLLGDGKAFVEVVLACVLSLGFQLQHKTTGRGAGGLPRHAPSGRVRLGGMTLGRLQCTTGRAVCTVLPPCVLRYRQRRPAGAREALVAPHGGRSLAWGAVRGTSSPMAL